VYRSAAWRGREFVAADEQQMGAAVTTAQARRDGARTSIGHDRTTES
jgi:hypothetical protein